MDVLKSKETNMNNVHNVKLRLGVIGLIIFMAAFSRLLPHPPNVAPIGAMALFGAAYFSRKYIALMVPILSMWLSDLVLNNLVYGQYFDHFIWLHRGAFFTYAAFLLIGLLGIFLLKKVNVTNVIIGAFSASVLFYLVSNFGVWVSGSMYPKNLNGLLTCYTAAIPFFRNTILGDFIYCAVLFSSFEIAQHKFPVLRYKPATTR